MLREGATEIIFAEPGAIKSFPGGQRLGSCGWKRELGVFKAEKITHARAKKSLRRGRQSPSVDQKT